jgi:hypothetical protein
MERTGTETVVASVNIHRYLPGGTEENHKNLGHGRCSGQDLNPKPPKRVEMNVQTIIGDYCKKSKASFHCNWP